uniref:Uncharacterized protein n=1 Tax=Schizaphis graminum TaxID=13262 RepID=A0A2S2NN56_SCHGA
MTTRHLLQDPVRAAIYRRGWDDRTADIQRTLQQQPRSTRVQSTTSSTPARPPRVTTQRPSQQPTPRPSQTTTPRAATQTAATVVAVRVADPGTSRGPTSVPGTSGTTVKSTTKVRTEAQRARQRKKFQKLKEKRQARELTASQQHRLAKQPVPESDPEVASPPPSETTSSSAMEVDEPTTKGETPEEPAATTNQAQQNQAARPETPSEDAWLAAPGSLLDGLPEMEYDKPFFTPAGSPNQP